MATPRRLNVASVSGERNRVTVLVRIILCIPQFIVVYFLNIANGICLFISWFIALFTGEWNPSLKNFCIGVYRWQLRRGVVPRCCSNDEYPPFSLEP